MLYWHNIILTSAADERIWCVHQCSGPQPTWGSSERRGPSAGPPMLCAPPRRAAAAAANNVRKGARRHPRPRARTHAAVGLIYKMQKSRRGETPSSRWTRLLTLYVCVRVCVCVCALVGVARTLAVKNQKYLHVISVGVSKKNHIKNIIRTEEKRYRL